MVTKLFWVDLVWCYVVAKVFWLGLVWCYVVTKVFWVVIYCPGSRVNMQVYDILVSKFGAAFSFNAVHQIFIFIIYLFIFALLLGENPKSHITMCSFQNYPMGFFNV